LFATGHQPFPHIFGHGAQDRQMGDPACAPK
jgi:hypothetical protein